jgi:hypothetical protein
MALVVAVLEWLEMAPMLLDFQVVQVDWVVEVEAPVQLALIQALAATEYFTSSIKRIKQ